MAKKAYDFEKNLEEIISQIRVYYHPRLLKVDENAVREAFEFAQKAHEDQFRFSGEPYFVHPVEATKILLSIKPDVETIIACLLHDVIEDTPVKADEIETLFGERVRFLCEGVEKVAKVKLAPGDFQEKKFENFQKLFIAMAQDIRVIFVKLADRIHNLRTLEHVRQEKQERIARESLEVYAPIAEKMGLFDFKSEIEDLSFKAIHPERYTYLSQEFRETKKARIKYIEQARREILKVVQTEKFSETIVSISGREKNLYSVYMKMKRKHLTHVEEVFDILGLRVLVRTKEDCYRTLGIIHGHWRPIPGRFKDYISVPKPNGYQSLHTTVLGIGQSRLPMEIQIRTEKMNIDAEAGPAAHWAYKKIGTSDFDAEYLAKTAWLPRKVPRNMPLSPEEFFEEVSQSIFSERVCVFTPQGDVKFLPYGATSVDYAYSVHTNIGDTCVGALVNGVMTPINRPLQNGDVVKILTKPGKTPNAQWLSFVRSSSARHKILSALRKAGEPVFAPVEKQEKKKKPEASSDSLLVRGWKSLWSKKPKVFVPQLVIGGETELAYRFAVCCNPSQDKPLLAYKSRGLEFVVHDAKCEELSRLDPERIFEARFLIIAKMHVHTKNRTGVCRDCIEVFSKRNIDVLDLRIQRLKGEGGVLHFEIGAPDMEDLEKARDEILSIHGIKKIEPLT